MNGKKVMKLLIATAVILLSLNVAGISLISHSYAHDYRAEIMEHTLKPCWMYGIKLNGLDKELSESEILEGMHLLAGDIFERTIRKMLPIVEGVPTEERMELYATGKLECMSRLARGTLFYLEVLIVREKNRGKSDVPRALQLAIDDGYHLHGHIRELLFHYRHDNCWDRGRRRKG